MKPRATISKQHALRDFIAMGDRRTILGLANFYAKLPAVPSVVYPTRRTLQLWGNEGSWYEEAEKHDQQVSVQLRAAQVGEAVQQYGHVLPEIKDTYILMLGKLKHSIMMLNVERPSDAKNLVEAMEKCIRLHQELSEGRFGKEEEQDSSTTDELKITYTRRFDKMRDRVKEIQALIAPLDDE